MARKKRNSLYTVFLKGILFFFSLENNPIKEYFHNQKKRSDADRIYLDWYNVGNDIRNAYGKIRASEKSC